METRRSTALTIVALVVFFATGGPTGCVTTPEEIINDWCKAFYDCSAIDFYQQYDSRSDCEYAILTDLDQRCQAYGKACHDAYVELYRCETGLFCYPADPMVVCEAEYNAIRAHCPDR